MTFFNPLLTALSQAGVASFNFLKTAVDACIEQYTKLQASIFTFKQRFSSSKSSKPAYPKSFGLFPEVPTDGRKRYADKDTIRGMFTAVFAEEITLYSAGNNDHLFKSDGGSRTPSGDIAGRSACAANDKCLPRGMRT